MHPQNADIEREFGTLFMHVHVRRKFGVADKEVAHAIQAEGHLEFAAAEQFHQRRFIERKVQQLSAFGKRDRSEVADEVGRIESILNSFGKRSEGCSVKIRERE